MNPKLNIELPFAPKIFKFEDLSDPTCNSLVIDENTQSKTIRVFVEGFCFPCISIEIYKSIIDEKWKVAIVHSSGSSSIDHIEAELNFGIALVVAANFAQKISNLLSN